MTGITSPRAAFVTSRAIPALTADDRLAAAALAELGVRTDAVCWDDEAVDWLEYGAIVVRSPWDYHLRIGEFHAWIDRLASLGAPLWNPPDVLRWNSDKRYLQSLEYPELCPPPTEVLARGSTVALPEFLRSHGWNEGVLKPTISADGFSTECTSLARAIEDQPLLDAMLTRSDVMVQQLVPEIRTRGELSLIFFGARFSHAVRKRPQAGEFRVQERLGGKISPADAPPAIVERAAALLGLAAPGCLYARVDIVASADRLVLMELELVEPSLFLEHAPDSPRAFASAVRDVIT